MYSAEKEKIDFVKFVNPVGKNVEDWMTERIHYLLFSWKYDENHNQTRIIALSRRLRQNTS